MKSMVRLFCLLGAFVLLSCVASSASAQYGYYYSNYPAYQSLSVGYSTPYGGYSTYYGPGYSTHYYSTPVYSTAYVAPQYYTTARVVVPPVFPVYRRPVYAPVMVPVPGFGFRYGF